jgi:hypothetical protein
MYWKGCGSEEGGTHTAVRREQTRIEHWWQGERMIHE